MCLTRELALFYLIVIACLTRLGILISGLITILVCWPVLAVLKLTDKKSEQVKVESEPQADDVSETPQKE